MQLTPITDVTELYKQDLQRLRTELGELIAAKVYIFVCPLKVQETNKFYGISALHSSAQKKHNYPYTQPLQLQTLVEKALETAQDEPNSTPS